MIFAARQNRHKEHHRLITLTAMIRFYAPDIATDPRLPEIESGHCVRVLRHKEGDEIEVVDGKGGLHRCVIAEARPKSVMLDVVESTDIATPWNRAIIIAVAPTKNMDRMEWMIEKLTEIGIDRFVPVRCEHSERKEIKTERLEKIAISAMKQSLKTSLPELAPITPLRDFVKSLPSSVSQRFIAYCNDDLYERKMLATSIDVTGDCAILIGPEGDFSPEEVSFAVDNGFTPISLGPCRLRTETAAIVAADTIHIISSFRQTMESQTT